MMLTFLELAYMVDATQHDGVGWEITLGKAWQNRKVSKLSL